MDASTKATLLGLSEKLDGDRAIFVAQALSRESRDADMAEVLNHFFAGFAKLPSSELERVETAIQPQLLALLHGVGLDLYVSALGPHRFSNAHLAVLLGPVRVSDQFVGDPPSVLDRLAALSGLDDVTVGWLAQLTAGTPELRPTLLAPLLSRLGTKAVDEIPELQRAAEAVLRHPAAVGTLARMLTDVPPPVLCGALRLLGRTQDPRYLQTIGSYLQDFGAWEYLSRVVLTPARLAAILAQANQSGLPDVLRDSRAVTTTGDGRAVSMATNPDFHRSVARFISAASPLSIVRALADPQVAAALKGFVSDVGAPVRLAGADGLSCFGTDDAIPFMRGALLDRSKEVRAVCQTWLRAHLGPEAYEALLGEMAEESRSLTERLSGLADWARAELTAIGSRLGTATGVVAAGVSDLGTRVWSLFDRKGAPDHE